MTPAYEKARSIALMLLGGEVVTPEEIDRAVENAVAAVSYLDGGASVDRAALTREIESKVRVWVGISGRAGRSPRPRGVAGRTKGDINWRFWSRYRRYLEEEQGLPRIAVLRTDELTDRILGRLEDPQRKGDWDRRGLIAGQVQSGKTGNYIGLMCKAADAGYKLIIVLAGIHNSLRSQTQLRVDQGFIGYDTQKRNIFSPENVWVGVGRLAGVDLPAIHSLTNSSEKGDFSTALAQKAAVDIGGNDPVVLVVKKNQTVLKNLIAWATTIRQQRDPNSDRMVVPGVPLLIIDDEADHASVNTADFEEAEPSKINGLIRDLLARFEQSAYVGYTATPFANILIDPGVNHPAMKDDLFPRSFIFTLKAPTDYIGPPAVFGVKQVTPDVEARAGLPLIRDIVDEELWMPRNHKKEWEPGPLPESLVAAIHSFVVTIAARRARGQILVHNSMLVHVTRFVAVQERVYDLVRDELDSLKNHLRYGDGASPYPIRRQLRELWESDYALTSAAIGHTSLDRQAVPVDWQAVDAELLKAVEQIDVTRINGTAKDALEYFEHPEGRHIIAVGGDKLSRGLTLEGLSVSYFLRASKMYDTLLQMGRWFGYRPGYLDLCRLYMSPELRGWFGTITSASEELMALFDEMADAGSTPSEFGLRIRSNPDGLTVTSPAKMQRGQKVKVSYAGNISETINFDVTPATQFKNLEATKTLVAEAKTYMPVERLSRARYQWENVPPESVTGFLQRFRTHEAAQKAQAINLRKYIEGRVADGELTKWTVLLASNATDSEATCNISGLEVSPFRRAPANVDPGEPVGVRYDIRRLVNPPDERVDLTEGQIRDALLRTQEQWEANRRPDETDADRPSEPGGPQLRKVREPERGLLIVYPLLPPPGATGIEVVMGFAISFPTSRFDSAVDYWVNQVYLQQEFQWEV